jgi:hypothetical protein
VLRRATALAGCLAATAGVAVHAQEPAGFVAKVADGTLYITENPGISGRLVLRHLEANYAITLGRHAGTAGAGCRNQMATLCSAAGIRAIEIDLGDGDDVFARELELHRRTVITLRAGPGDDTVRVPPDGTRDWIDCGPGHDRLSSGLEGVVPPGDNDYFGCPPAGVQISFRGVIRGRRALVGVSTPRPVRLSARLFRSSDGRLLARSSEVLVRHNRTLRFKLAHGLDPEAGVVSARFHRPRGIDIGRWAQTVTFRPTGAAPPGLSPQPRRR